jgi:hypothetical protein
MTVRLEVQQTEFTIDVDGAEYRVTARGGGRRYESPPTLATKVGGREVTAATAADLHRAVQVELREQAAKAAGRARRSAARPKADPQPAIMVDRDGTLSTVTVRGVHATGGDVLITDVVGGKLRVSPGSVLRVLTDDETQRLKAAFAARAAADEAVKSPVRWYEAEGRTGLVAVAASYDLGTGRWIAEWNGIRFAAETGRVLQSEITKAVVAAEYPWTVDRDDDDGDRVIPSKDADHWGHLFHTREDAEAWLAASKAAAAAETALRALLDEYAFDLSPYREGQ